MVVGAGPAGSIAALTAARRGFRVALVDQRTFPRDKPCGDGIGPGVVRVLHRLGLDHVLAGEHPTSSVTAYGPDSVDLTAALHSFGDRSTQGYVIPRARFDQKLRLAALAEGAADLAGHRVTDTGQDRQRRWVNVRRDGADRRLSAFLVVGADGAHSMVRRLLGLPRPSPRHTAIAMRAYSDTVAFDRGEPLEARMIFEWSRATLPTYGWVFPTSAGTVNVGLGVMLSQLQRRHLSLRDGLERFADSCRQRGIELGDLVGHRSHHLPLAGDIPRLAHDRAVLVGDAASMINPLSGEGIAYGMSAAVHLIGILPPRLDEHALVVRALNEFEQWFRRTHRAHLISCSIARRLMTSPWWAKQMLRAADRDAGVRRDVVTMLFDLGRIRAGTTWRIVRQRGWQK